MIAAIAEKVGFDPSQHIVALPERLTPYQEALEEPTHFGGITIASAPFAEPYTNETILSFVPDNEREEARQMVEGTGITTRYFGHLDRADRAEIVEEAASVSALLIRQTITAQGWLDADHVIVTSAFLPELVTELALTRAGLNPQRVTHQSYRLACAGAVTALVDTLARPELSDKRVVIVAAEPLSTLFDNRHFTRDHIGIPAIFGDDYAAIGFRPRDYELAAAKTLFIPDQGIIKLAAWYDMPVHDDSLTLPHHTFAPGAREITAVSPRGVFMKLISPDNGMSTEMNGMATAKFFIRHTPPVIAEVLEKAKEKHIRPTVAVVHQPSGPVIEGMARPLGRLYPDAPPIRFQLPVLGRSNSSSATTLVAWQGMIKRGEIEPHQPFLLAAPGIGSAITAAVIVPR